MARRTSWQRRTPPTTTPWSSHCIFFRGADSTHIERQVNYFLTYAPLAALNHQETNIVGEDVLVTLWFEPMPNAANLDEVYSAAIHLVP